MIELATVCRGSADDVPRLLAIRVIVGAVNMPPPDVSPPPTLLMERVVPADIPGNVSGTVSGVVNVPTAVLGLELKYSVALVVAFPATELALTRSEAELLMEPVLKRNCCPVLVNVIELPPVMEIVPASPDSKPRFPDPREIVAADTVKAPV